MLPSSRASCGHVLPGPARNLSRATAMQTYPSSQQVGPSQFWPPHAPHALEHAFGDEVEVVEVGTSAKLP